MSKNILECPYCKSIITEKDTTCPKCGADCNDVIKKYHKEKQDANENLANDIGNAFFKTAMVAITICTIVVSLIIFTVVAISMHTRDRSQIKGLVDNSVKTEKYEIKIGEFEEYEYYDDFFKDKCNTKEGYKKVAFKITFENKSSINIGTFDFLSSLIVKADDQVLSQKALTEDTNFCEVIKGTNNYNKFPSTDVLPNDRVSGYLGYEVPTNIKKIKFIFNKNQIIEMDNPVYQDE